MYKEWEPARSLSLLSHTERERERRRDVPGDGWVGAWEKNDSSFATGSPILQSSPLAEVDFPLSWLSGEVPPINKLGRTIWYGLLSMLRESHPSQARDLGSNGLFLSEVGDISWCLTRSVLIVGQESKHRYSKESFCLSRPPSFSATHSHRLDLYLSLSNSGYALEPKMISGVHICSNSLSMNGLIR